MKLLVPLPPSQKSKPGGVSHSEVEAAFPAWKVTDVGPTGFEAPKPIELLPRPDERWYRLRRQ